MKALVFPGQGSQFVGMGKIFYENSVFSRKIFDQADEILGYSLTHLMFEGSIEELTKTRFAQPALLTTSIAMLNEFLKTEDKNIEDICSYVAGHSLGEYSALVAAKVLTFEDALKLMQLRGELMETSFDGEGSMVAVLGLVFEDIISCLPNDQTCVVANDNAPGQIVISGEKKSVEDAVLMCLKKGAKRCITLPVSAAFHSPYMKKAQDKMEHSIEKLTFKDAAIPLISNVLAKPLITAIDIKTCLKQQICHSVRWRESILFLEEQNIKEIIEIGSGSVLTGLNKRISPNISSVSYQNIYEKSLS